MAGFDTTDDDSTNSTNFDFGSPGTDLSTADPDSVSKYLTTLNTNWHEQDPSIHENSQLNTSENNPDPNMDYAKSTYGLQQVAGLNSALYDSRNRLKTQYDAEVQKIGNNDYSALNTDLGSLGKDIHDDWSEKLGNNPQLQKVYQDQFGADRQMAARSLKGRQRQLAQSYYNTSFGMQSDSLIKKAAMNPDLANASIEKEFNQSIDAAQSLGLYNNETANLKRSAFKLQLNQTDANQIIKEQRNYYDTSKSPDENLNDAYERVNRLADSGKVDTGLTSYIMHGVTRDVYIKDAMSKIGKARDAVTTNLGNQQSANQQAAHYQNMINSISQGQKVEDDAVQKAFDLHNQQQFNDTAASNAGNMDLTKGGTMGYAGPAFGKTTADQIKDIQYAHELAKFSLKSGADRSAHLQQSQKDLQERAFVNDPNNSDLYFQHQDQTEQDFQLQQDVLSKQRDDIDFGTAAKSTTQQLSEARQQLQQQRLDDDEIRIHGGIPDAHKDSSERIDSLAKKEMQEQEQANQADAKQGFYGTSLINQNIDSKAQHDIDLQERGIDQQSHQLDKVKKADNDQYKADLQQFKDQQYVHNELAKKAKEDPVGLASSQGLIKKPEPIDYSNPKTLGGSLALRQSAANIASQHYGVNAPPLTKQEAYEFGNRYSSSAPDDQINMISSVYSNLTKATADNLMKTVDPQNYKGMRDVAGLASTGNMEGAKNMLVGAAALKDKSVQFPKGGLDNSALQKALNTMPDYEDNQAAKVNIMRMLPKILAGQAVASGSNQLPQDADSITSALNQITHGGSVAIGDKGSKVEPYEPGATKNDMNNAIAHISLKDTGPIAGIKNDSELRQYLMHDLDWTSKGEGKYAIGIRQGNNFTRLQNTNGQPVILNLRDLVHRNPNYNAGLLKGEGLLDGS